MAALCARCSTWLRRAVTPNTLARTKPATITTNTYHDVRCCRIPITPTFGCVQAGLKGIRSRVTAAVYQLLALLTTSRAATLTEDVLDRVSVLRTRRGSHERRSSVKFSLSRKKLATVALVASAAIGGAGIATAATGTTTPTSPAAPATPATDSADTQTGVDQSNNDPTHEAGESAEREAAETAGQGGGGGRGDHHSNTDPAHEASESPEPAAQEAADDAALGTPTGGEPG